MAAWRTIEAHDAASRTHEAVCTALQVNSSVGLTAAEVADRRVACGPNELPEDDEDPLWKKFLEQFKDPMIGLLLTSAVISFLVGQWDDAVSILIVSELEGSSFAPKLHSALFQAITIVTTVAFIQEYKSDQSIAALRDLAPTTCAVLRDGSAVVLQASEVVPGDIIILRTGDKVPCDCRVISSHGLSVDESSLTGEGRPARKQAPPVAAAHPPHLDSEGHDAATADLADLKCIAFMGTFVQGGRGRVVAVGTGAHTVLGGMVHLMAATEDGRSPLQERMDALGQTISVISIAIIVVMVLFGTAVMGRPLLETFTMGVSLAVAAIPEGLPIVVTVTLALSVQRMSKRQAVVKKLPAVEALGCATVVCADKTGTLTANQMTATRVWGFAAPERPARSAASAGKGSAAVVAHALLKDLASAVSRQQALPTSGHTVTLGGGGYSIGSDDGPRCNDTPVDVASTPQLLAALNSAAICCNAQVGGARGGASREVAVVGQPTEAAMLVAADKAGVSPRVDCGSQDPSVPATPSVAGALSPAGGSGSSGGTLGGDAGSNAPLQRTLEVPFSHGSKWMAVRVRDNQGQPVGSAVAEGEYGGSPDAGWAMVAGETYHVKGAAEVVVPLCAFALGPSGTALPLDGSHVEAVHAAALDMARQGLRVVAVAAGDSIPQFPPAARAHSTWPPGDAGDDNEDSPGGSGGGVSPGGQGHGLVFLGLVGIHDAPRQQAESSIAALRRGGVTTVMITGDSKPTALAIGRQLGLIGGGRDDAVQDDATALSGSEVDRLSPQDLGRRLGSVRVLYRTTPKHKLKIVQALKGAGHVVAMTGDGVNDAPALRAADIGIAMGSGTEVAKQAAHMVLLNDDLASVVAAVREGKGTFFNIRNFCRFQLSTSVAALGLVAVTTALGLPNALSPMMVLFINILMDGAPAISLGVEPVPAAVMDKAPRPRQEPIVTRGLLCRVLMAGSIMLLGTLFVYQREMMADGTVSTRDTTMTFATFVLFDMFNALASRSSTHSVFALGLGANSFFNMAVGGSLLSLVLLVHFPPLQAVFQTEALAFGDWVFVTLLASTVLWADEARKRVVASAASSGSWPLPPYLLGVEEWQSAEDASQSLGMPACVQQLLCCLRMRCLQRLMGGGSAPGGGAQWAPLPTDEEPSPGAHRSYADVAAGNHK